MDFNPLDLILHLDVYLDLLVNQLRAMDLRHSVSGDLL
jgi:hypothetical protein